MTTEAALLGATGSDRFTAARTRWILKTIEAMMSDPCFCRDEIAATLLAHDDDTVCFPVPRKKIQ